MPASKPARFRRSWMYFVAGLAHALAMLLAFPPFDLWRMAVAAPMPLVWAAWRRGVDLREQGRRGVRGRAVWMVPLGVAPFHLYSHQWMLDVTAIGFPVFIVAMSMMSGLFVWAGSNVMARWPRLPLCVAAPLVWTGLEVMRGEVVFSGYPWMLAAHPLIGAPWVPGTAALLGTYYAGFLVLVLAALVVDLTLTRMKPVAGLGVVGLLAGAVGLGVALWPGESEEAEFTVGVVQSNIPQSNKLEWKFEDRWRDMGAFGSLTKRAAGGADVVVWPETMFPGLTLSESGLAAERAAGLAFRVPREVDPRGEVPSTEFAQRLVSLAQDIGKPMLVGAVGFEGLSIVEDAKDGLRFDYAKRFNSVFLLKRDAGGFEGWIDPRPYSKIDLTPFGETMPGIRHWPWLQKQLTALGAGGLVLDLSSGDGPRVFDIGGVGVVTPVCFEATKPALCRKLVNAAAGRPAVMVNLTNDGWFAGFRPGRLQHLQIARWRCVELGVPMVRAANTGISAAIDSRGRVTASGVDGRPGAWNEEGVLTAKVRPNRARTLYARVGDVFGWTVLCMALVAWGWALATLRGGTKEQQA
ncbi:MAG: apolipoprotein N-acyltransferase [Phycisphaeraceae bacterium]|nr:apolipoprotein N-acyltransferase [Phycisphaeraceae bacterium]